jgi:hypothetical protein
VRLLRLDASAEVKPSGSASSARSRSEAQHTLRVL